MCLCCVTAEPCQAEDRADPLLSSAKPDVCMWQHVPVANAAALTHGPAHAELRTMADQSSLARPRVWLLKLQHFDSIPKVTGAESGHVQAMEQRHRSSMRVLEVRPASFIRVQGFSESKSLSAMRTAARML